MHDKIMGRSDDMIILKGVNIYPGQVDEVLSAIPEVGSEYQLHLERKPDGKEYMTIRVEAAQGVDPEMTQAVQSRLKKLVHSKIMVSCIPDICAYGDLPRYPGKAQRIFDTRDK
jgi:phenylacetate-CoA ligase